VRRDAVERHGPPRPGFWIWSDDIDFFGRILRDEHGYLVPESVAVHKTQDRPHAVAGQGALLLRRAQRGFIVARRLAAAEGEGRWVLLVSEQVRLFLVLERFRPWAVRVVLRVCETAGQEGPMSVRRTVTGFVAVAAATLAVQVIGFFVLAVIARRLGSRGSSARSRSR
jgi:hypothetical protein